MSKLDLASRIPFQYERQPWTDIIRAITGQLNPLSEGRLAAKYNAQTAAPTGSVSYAVGDFVPDINCTVGSSVAAGLGLPYIRIGWVCRVSGTPGTFEEVRILTGGGSVIAAVSASPITNSLGSDVSLNNAANYFDGPSVAQGSTGTWLATGTVTLATTTACNYSVKLWDGTTVISSAVFSGPTNLTTKCSISGYLATPAGNIRISVKSSQTDSVMKFNSSGNSKDSTITAIKIQS